MKEYREFKINTLFSFLAVLFISIMTVCVLSISASADTAGDLTIIATDPNTVLTAEDYFYDGGYLVITSSTPVTISGKTKNNAIFVQKDV